MTAPVTVIGNLTRDPELRYTAGGRALASFGVAANRRYQVNGEWTEQVSFFDVTCWADLAEHVANCLTKGTRVVVHGRLEQRSWENDAGEKRSKIEVVADDIGASVRFTNVTVERLARTKTTAEEAPSE